MQLAIIDAINEPEAHKILSQQEVVIKIERTENMYRLLLLQEKEDMITSFKQTHQNSNS